MNTLLITVVIGLIFIITKMIIDIYSLFLFIRKDKEITKQPNELEKDYQFIKGLY